MNEQWTEPVSSLKCMTKMGPVGSLNGYVGVGKGHPLFGTDYYSCIVCTKKHCYKPSHKSPESIFDVHGGLTYSGFWNGFDTWWFGFDTAHAGDFVPDLAMFGMGGGQVRDLSYVEQNCEHLARQLHEYDTWRTRLWRVLEYPTRFRIRFTWKRKVA